MGDFDFGSRLAIRKETKCRNSNKIHNGLIVNIEQETSEIEQIN